MRFLLATLILLFSIGVVQAADPVFPQGSSVGLVPPRGMSLATSFAGFQDEARGAAIAITTFPPVAYTDIIRGFSDDGKLAQQGITAERRENLSVSGNPALLLIGRQQIPTGSVHKWIIIVGSAKAAALVTAQYKDAAAATYPDAVIRAALTSVTFRDSPTLAEQAAALPFTVPALGRFRIISALSGNSLGLTDVPKDADPEYDQATFVAALTTAVPAPAERDAFGRNGLLGLRAIQITAMESAKIVAIEGLPAHEILGSAQTQTGVRLRVVQWLLFGPTSTVHLLGTARPAQFDQMYPEFVALRNGIHLK
jgi:hypothetical protein